MAVQLDVAYGVAAERVTGHGLRGLLKPYLGMRYRDGAVMDRTLGLDWQARSFNLKLEGFSSGSAHTDSADRGIQLLLQQNWQ